MRFSVEHTLWEDAGCSKTYIIGKRPVGDYETLRWQLHT
jgi:hypothetical protein